MTENHSEFLMALFWTLAKTSPKSSLAQSGLLNPGINSSNEITNILENDKIYIFQNIILT